MTQQTVLLEVVQEGKTFAMTPTELLQSLTYRSYKYNRQRCPQYAPSWWAPIFPQWERFEAQLQQEQST